MQSSYQSKINTALKDLSTTNSFSSALLICNTLLEYMGVETKNIEDIELSKLKLPNAERYDRWFDAHPHFRGDRACFDLTSKESPLEAKFFAIQKRSKLFIAGSVNFTPNFEDRDYTRNDPSMRIGIDFFFPPEKNSIIVVLSNKGNLRLVELGTKLTNTQIEIFNIWEGVVNSTTDKNVLHTTIWESFKLSSLNKKFYEGISNSFISLTQHLKNNNVEEQLANQFANRLHGRLLFLWFLRKKNIVNDTKEYFVINNQEDTDYYREKLEYLFFNVLNTDIPERDSFQKTKETLFGIEKGDPTLFIADSVTPYLNGGLFDQKADGEYWSNNRPTFPKGFFKTLYEHFDSFNFTTDESTPEYEQIAIDPEMLGRIFESFLATLTTETGAQAKKANGAFYTPREIVSYMSRESLRQYLYTTLDAGTTLKTSIDDLLDLPDRDWALAGTNSKRDAVSKEDRERIMDTLRKIKVLDPAVGSGAFPMGVLHKILNLFERLEPKFDSYETKLSILKNNIYGVDIDPTAIEISRLRAWLSIIVDVKDIKKIKPLPNLDFKFVCANSLIGLEKSIASLSSDENLKPELIRIRDEYYATSSKTKKEKLQKEYIRLTHPGQSAMFDTEETRQLKSYQPFENGKRSSFYDPEIMHGVEAFDVIIGNPPYVGEKGNKEVFSLLKKSTLGKKFYQGKMDLFYLFFHLGLDFLKDGGVMSFITTNYYPTASGAIKLRSDFQKRATILHLSNFNELKIFESALGQKNIITTLRKGNTGEVANCFYTHQKGIADAQKIIKILNREDEKTSYFQHNQDDLYYGNNICIKSEITDTVQINFEKESLTGLGDLFDVSQGVVEGPDRVMKENAIKFNLPVNKGVFIISNSEVEDLHLNQDEQHYVKKYLSTKDIKRYQITKPNTRLLYISKENCDDIDKLPNIKKHLVQFKSIMEQRRETQKGSNEWFQMHWPRKKEYFDNPKLICKGMFARPEFTYDDENYYVGFSFSVIWLKNKDYSLKYLLGLLNSKVGEKWFNQNGKKRGVGVDIGVGIFRMFPVPKLSNENRLVASKIESLVDQILSAKKSDPKASTLDLEDQIDTLVYGLYGLNEEEIELISNS